MESLYLLIPVSALLILIIVAIFGWAVHSGQFEDVEREGERFLQADADITTSAQQPAESPS
jgi:cbb3-type cytochrome oxidase maturation protein